MEETDWKGIALQQQTRLNALEASQDKATVEAALSAAIGAHKVVDDGRAQLMTLLKDSVALVPDGQGGKVAMAGGVPVEQFVKGKLATQEYAKFVRHDARGSNPTAYNPGAADALQPGEARAAFQAGRLPLGAAIIAEHTAGQATQSQDPRLNVSMPMGIDRVKGS